MGYPVVDLPESDDQSGVHGYELVPWGKAIWLSVRISLIPWVTVFLIGSLLSYDSTLMYGSIVLSVIAWWFISELKHPYHSGLLKISSTALYALVYVISVFAIHGYVLANGLVDNANGFPIWIVRPWWLLIAYLFMSITGSWAIRNDS